jgi:hypothetical protein
LSTGGSGHDAAAARALQAAASLFLRAFILLGLAVALSKVYPRWLGWVAFLAGLISIGAGLIQAYAGEPTDASRILTIIGPTVITLWLPVMGVLLFRRRPTEEPI